MQCGSGIAMKDPLHPTEGIRLLLERKSISEDQQSAVYGGAIYGVESLYLSVVRLAMDGSAEIVEESENTDPAALSALLKLSKSTARAAKRKHSEKLPPWPPRVLRWRGPGRG